MQHRALWFALLVALSCRPSPVREEPEPTTPAVADRRILPAAGLDPVDTTLDPCEDFYQYACGPWLAGNPRPAGAELWARSFSVAEARVQERVQALLAGLASASDPAQAQLGSHWRACLDGEGRTAGGLTAIEPLLAAIDRVDRKSLWTVVGTLQAHGVQAVLRLRSVPGGPGSLSVGIAGTGLGPAEMYDPGSAGETLAQYRVRVAELLRLSGVSEPADRAARVVAFEAELSRLQPTLAELMAEPADPVLPRPLAELRRLAPVPDWERLFAALGRPLPERVQLAPRPRLAELAELLARTDLAVLRDYLRWQVLDWTAPILPPALATVSPAPPLATSCLREVEAAFGPALGRAYIERYVADADRTRVTALAEGLRGALRDELTNATWIDPRAGEILHRALTSLPFLVAVAPRPAAPEPSPAGFAAASLALRKARVARRLSGDSGPSSLPPTAINGGMNGSSFELTAGILQPPFYAADMPGPVLLGALGQIVAHELGHFLDPETLAGLDWRPEPGTVQAFAERTRCIEDRYGAAAAKEAFADNLGLRVAHRVARADGRAAERQFFVAWAQLMCMHYSPGALQRQSMMDTPPAPLRINKALAGYPAFASTFACREGAAMNPANACRPW